MEKSPSSLINATNSQNSAAATQSLELSSQNFNISKLHSQNNSGSSASNQAEFNNTNLPKFQLTNFKEQLERIPEPINISLVKINGKIGKSIDKDKFIKFTEYFDSINENRLFNNNKLFKKDENDHVYFVIEINNCKLRIYSGWEKVKGTKLNIKRLNLANILQNCPPLNVRQSAAQNQPENASQIFANSQSSNYTNANNEAGEHNSNNSISNFPVIKLPIESRRRLERNKSPVPLKFSKEVKISNSTEPRVRINSSLLKETSSKENNHYYNGAKVSGNEDIGNQDADNSNEYIHGNISGSENNNMEELNVLSQKHQPKSGYNSSTANEVETNIEAEEEYSNNFNSNTEPSKNKAGIKLPNFNLNSSNNDSEFNNRLKKLSLDKFLSELNQKTGQQTIKFINKKGKASEPISKEKFIEYAENIMQEFKKDSSYNSSNKILKKDKNGEIYFVININDNLTLKIYLNPLAHCNLQQLGIEYNKKNGTITFEGKILLQKYDDTSFYLSTLFKENGEDVYLLFDSDDCNLWKISTHETEYIYLFDPSNNKFKNSTKNAPKKILEIIQEIAGKNNNNSVKVIVNMSNTSKVVPESNNFEINNKQKNAIRLKMANLNKVNKPIKQDIEIRLFLEYMEKFFGNIKNIYKTETETSISYIFVVTDIENTNNIYTFYINKNKKILLFRNEIGEKYDITFDRNELISKTEKYNIVIKQGRQSINIFSNLKMIYDKYKNYVAYRLIKFQKSNISNTEEFYYEFDYRKILDEYVKQCQIDNIQIFIDSIISAAKNLLYSRGFLIYSKDFNNLVIVFLNKSDKEPLLFLELNEDKILYVTKELETSQIKYDTQQNYWKVGNLFFKQTGIFLGEKFLDWNRDRFFYWKELSKNRRLIPSGKNTSKPITQEQMINIFKKYPMQFKLNTNRLVEMNSNNIRKLIQAAQFLSNPSNNSKSSELVKFNPNILELIKTDEQTGLPYFTFINGNQEIIIYCKNGEFSFEKRDISKREYNNAVEIKNNQSVANFNLSKIRYMEQLPPNNSIHPKKRINIQTNIEGEEEEIYINNFNSNENDLNQQQQQQQQKQQQQQQQQINNGSEQIQPSHTNNVGVNNSTSTTILRKNKSSAANSSLSPITYMERLPPNERISLKNSGSKNQNIKENEILEEEENYLNKFNSINNNLSKANHTLPTVSPIATLTAANNNRNSIKTAAKVKEATNAKAESEAIIRILRRKFNKYLLNNSNKFFVYKNDQTKFKILEYNSEDNNIIVQRKMYNYTKSLDGNYLFSSLIPSEMVFIIITNYGDIYIKHDNQENKRMLKLTKNGQNLEWSPVDINIMPFNFVYNIFNQKNNNQPKTAAMRPVVNSIITGAVKKFTEEQKKLTHISSQNQIGKNTKAAEAKVAANAKVAAEAKAAAEAAAEAKRKSFALTSAAAFDSTAKVAELKAAAEVKAAANAKAAAEAKEAKAKKCFENENEFIVGENNEIKIFKIGEKYYLGTTKFTFPHFNQYELNKDGSYLKTTINNNEVIYDLNKCKEKGYNPFKQFYANNKNTVKKKEEIKKEQEKVDLETAKETFALAAKEAAAKQKSKKEKEIINNFEQKIQKINNLTNKTQLNALEKNINNNWKIINEEIPIRNSSLWTKWIEAKSKIDSKRTNLGKLPSEENNKLVVTTSEKTPFEKIGNILKKINPF